MKSLMLLSAVAALVAATLNAQVTAPKPDSTCTHYPDGRVECRVFRRGVPGDSALRNRILYRMDSAMAKRAALGLELRTTGTRRDTLGVFVEAVTPKGPAETAGIIEGDRIASINGVDLRTSAADTEDSYTNGLAAHRLAREVQKLSPGARVTLRVYSGGRFRDVQVTAAKASDVMHLGNRFRFAMPGMGGTMEFGGPGTMMLGPEMPMMPDRMEPLMREQIEPLLRERMNDWPDRIQFRPPVRIRTLGPARVRAPRTYRVNGGGQGELRTVRPPTILSLDGGEVWLEAADAPDVDELFLNIDDEPVDFEMEIVPVSADTIRELAATTIRSAQSALKKLAAEGIA
ncbi:MAG TPA: PDZ domain-containing protein [Gemmatimonadaceae bacterium]